MEEKPTQPAPAETGALDQQIESLLSSAADESAPGESTDPSTLNEQLDTMMSADEKPAGGAANAALSAASALSASDASAAKSAETAADAESELAGDDLAKQIQELLDTAKETADGTSPKPAPGIAPAAAPATMSDATATPPAVSGETTAPDEAVQKIDEALAQSADDAIAGDFETVAEASGQAAETTAAAAADTQPARADHAPADSDAEPDLEGGFASPEELINSTAAPAATGFAATAASVGRELDEQPEKGAKPAKVPKPPKAKKPRDPNAPGLLRRTLMVINAPLLHASKPVRDGVGWVALLTIFNGSMLLMARTVFHVTGQPDPNAIVETHDAESGHGEAKPKEKSGASDHGGEGGHDAKPKPKTKAKPKAEAKKPGKKAAGDHGAQAEAGGH